MSAPEPLDCQAAADRLYEYLDGELTAEVEAAVRAHLTDCAPCFSLFGFEEAYLKFLSARTQARKAPEHLRKRVFQQILFGQDSSGTQ